MPTLNVKAFAELLNLPAIQQQKVLYSQKYPKDEPQIFRIPFYSKSLSAISKYYRNSNQSSIINSAINEINTTVEPKPKRENNVRVLRCFLGSKQAKRSLNVISNKKFSISINSVDIRLSFDISSTEKGKGKYIFYNWRNIPIDTVVARRTVEIAGYVLEKAKAGIDVSQIELVDLAVGKTYRSPRIKPSTVNLILNNINIIDAIWKTI